MRPFLVPNIIMTAMVVNYVSYLFGTPLAHIAYLYIGVTSLWVCMDHDEIAYAAWTPICAFIPVTLNFFLGLESLLTTQFITVALCVYGFLIGWWRHEVRRELELKDGA